MKGFDIKVFKKFQISYVKRIKSLSVKIVMR